jgi:hypothetical protein
LLPANLPAIITADTAIVSKTDPSAIAIIAAGGAVDSAAFGAVKTARALR